MYRTMYRTTQSHDQSHDQSQASLQTNWNGLEINGVEIERLGKLKQLETTAFASPSMVRHRNLGLTRKNSEPKRKNLKPKPYRTDQE